MSATSNDSPTVHDTSPSQWPPLVPGSGPWGQAPHRSTYTWSSWLHILLGMGVPLTSSQVYTWPQPLAWGSTTQSPQPRPSRRSELWTLHAFGLVVVDLCCICGLMDFKLSVMLM
jgi:hypothetical protein